MRRSADFISMMRVRCRARVPATTEVRSARFGSCIEWDIGGRVNCVRGSALAALVSLMLGGCSMQNIEAISACQDVSEKPEVRIDSCTVAINSAKQSPATVAAELTNRGIAYALLGGYDRAIQDYDAALALNPSAVDALFNRGLLITRCTHSPPRGPRATRRSTASPVSRTGPAPSRLLRSPRRGRSAP